MNKTTQELLNNLRETREIQPFISENIDEFLDISVDDYLNDMLTAKKMKVSQVAKRSGQDSYVYKIFSGNRVASRNVLLAIALGMNMTVPEAQKLLRIAQVAQLDPRYQRDAVVIFALNKRLTIGATNEVLFELKEELF